MALPTHKAIVGSLCLAACLVTPASGQEPRPAAIEPDTAGTMMLSPASPYRLYLGSRQGFKIVDADEAVMRGTIHGGYGPVLAVAPDNSRFYVSESYWSRENRGTRVDLVSVYNSETLLLEKEIQLPGRLIVSGRQPFFNISADGKRGFVFNMEPASSVQVLDLQDDMYVSTVEIPGCGGLYPLRNEGFVSLCADGTVGTYLVDAKGKAKVTHSNAFFDAEQNPVFEESIVDRETGKAIFITYTGMIHPAMLGAKTTFSKPFSLQSVANLSDANPDVQQKTWRPGGRRPFAYHRDSDTLFVLMHEGKHWSQKVHGTQIWAVKVADQQLVGRFQMPTAGRVVGVSQGEKPLLYAAGDGGYLWILDPSNGKILRQLDEMGRAGMIAVTGF